MNELDRRIATLRLKMAELKSREEQMRSLERQFETQQEKVVEFAVYERGDLQSALSMASELDDRLNETRRTLRHLGMIRTRAQVELDTLVLTRAVESARGQLTKLEARRLQLESEVREAVGGRLPEGTESEEDGGTETSRLAEISALDAEIKRLRQTIDEASEEAARTVASRRARQG